MEPANHPASTRLELVRVLTRQQPFILAYAYAIVRDHHLAEDVYQEVALILAEEWESVPAGVPQPWLKELVRRKALELGRRSRRHALLSPEAISALGEVFPTAEDGGGDEDLRRAMADCLGKLPAEARTVLDGRYRDGESCEAIAARVGRSVQGVYAVLKRVRVALADCVGRVDPRFREEAGHA